VDLPEEVEEAWRAGLSQGQERIKTEHAAAGLPDSERAQLLRLAMIQTLEEQCVEPRGPDRLRRSGVQMCTT
jgi:hypothetical protein